LFLRRGGRPRRSTWWRAWLARLLPSAGGSAPTPPVPTSATLAVSTGILSIAFDQAIDDMETSALAAQYSVTDGSTVFPGVSYVDIVGTTVRIQIGFPGVIPLDMTCTLSSGSGVVLGMNGLPVAPFAGFPVAIV